MTLFVHKRTVSFGDTDAAGIVYTPRFSHFCMEAAECWFREVLDLDWYQINVGQGFGTPVVHMQIDFVSPLIGGDLLAVEIAVEKIGRSTVTLGFRGLKGSSQDLVFTGQIVFCCAAKASGSVPIPAKQRQLIDEYIDASKD